MGWDKNSLTIEINWSNNNVKERWIKHKKNKWCTMHLLTMLWMMPSLSLSRDQQLPASSPQFTNQTWYPMIWNIPWVSLYLLSWPCYLSAACAPPHCQNRRSWKILDLEKTLLKQQLKYFCYSHYAPAKPKPQHCTSY